LPLLNRGASQLKDVQKGLADPVMNSIRASANI
jgi:hypothetical protein